MTIPLWPAWVFIALLGAESVAKVVTIDVPRKPLTKGDAAAGVVLNTIVIVFVLWLMYR